MNLRARHALAGSGALLTTTLAVAAPTAAQTPTPTPAQAASGPVATKADASLTVRSVRRHVVKGRSVVVTGVLRPRGAGRAVSLQVRGSNGRYLTVDKDRTDGRGTYRLTWEATRTGSHRLRVHFGGTRELSSAKRRVGTANVYRRALASWYGPGFWGGHLACGGRLSPGMLGVAHKTLPCGTKVTLRYKGRTARVPVIDRGPYVGAREFDLTAATKARLGFGGTGTVLVTR
ncbi:MAG: hypothetical protein HZB46_04995 [Solirubrobacterales bacterium]|nr:hypothetical protein [Solirubrobacterales bacterium]